ncbi:MAG: PilW family protein [Limisphaerales bacterium]
MDCKITFLTNRRSQCAMTLVELLVAVFIGSLLMTGVAALSIYTARSFAALGNYMELDKNSRNTLDRMTQLIRESDGVLDWTKHELVLSYKTQPLTFKYLPSDKKLVMTETNGTQSALLEGCDFLNFEIFQRTTMSGTYDQYPVTADEAAAKIVQISWVCSKKLIGSLINSESVQSAKIVIRKQ